MSRSPRVCTTQGGKLISKEEFFQMKQPEDPTKNAVGHTGLAAVLKYAIELGAFNKMKGINRNDIL